MFKDRKLFFFFFRSIPGVPWLSDGLAHWSIVFNLPHNSSLGAASLNFGPTTRSVAYIHEVWGKPSVNHYFFFLFLMHTPPDLITSFKDAFQLYISMTEEKSTNTSCSTSWWKKKKNCYSYITFSLRSHVRTTLTISFLKFVRSSVFLTLPLFSL